MKFRPNCLVKTDLFEVKICFYFGVGHRNRSSRSQKLNLDLKKIPKVQKLTKNRKIISLVFDNVIRVIVPELVLMTDPMFATNFLFQILQPTRFISKISFF